MMRKIFIVLTISLTGCAGLSHNPCTDYNTGEMKSWEEKKQGGFTQKELEKIPSWCFSKPADTYRIYDKRGKFVGTARR